MLDLFDKVIYSATVQLIFEDLSRPVFLNFSTR